MRDWALFLGIVVTLLENYELGRSQQRSQVPNGIRVQISTRPEDLLLAINLKAAVCWSALARRGLYFFFF